MTQSPKCPDDSQVHLFLAGELDSGRRLGMLAHAANCNACCALLGALASPAISTPGLVAKRPPPTHLRTIAATPAAPKLLGRFEVIAKLGEGGMGAVYDAYDPQLDRRVAVKVIRFAAETEARLRLLREAQAMAKVAHPNVVTVYEVGHHGDETFVVMERIEGQTLTKWLEGTQRSSRDVLEKLADAGRGLAAVHAAGMVHRDFKPDNVIVGDDGRVRVLDFGLARLRESGRFKAAGTNAFDLEITDEGMVVGTPTFMAPEQHRGEMGDAKSDQFAYGVALYRALFRTPPFEGKSLEALARSVCQGRVKPPPPESSAPDTVVAATLRALAPSPNGRLPSVDAVVAEIDRALAPPRVDFDPLVARGLRRRAAAIGFGGGVLALVATFLRDGFRLSGPVVLYHGLWALSLMVAIVVLFRRVLFVTAYDRAVWLIFTFPIVAFNLTCLLTIPRGIQVDLVLLANTMMIAVAMALGALLVEPWLGLTAVVALVYAVMLAVFGERVVIGFPAVLFFGLGLPLYVWREPTVPASSKEPAGSHELFPRPSHYLPTRAKQRL